MVSIKTSRHIIGFICAIQSCQVCQGSKQPAVQRTANLGKLNLKQFDFILTKVHLGIEQLAACCSSALVIMPCFGIFVYFLDVRLVCTTAVL